MTEKNNSNSLPQRTKLKEERKYRLAVALRKNLQKRKEQIRARKQCSISNVQHSE